MRIDRVLFAGVVGSFAAFGWQLTAGCSRRTEIAEQNQGGSNLNNPMLDAGDIPEVDAGLGEYPPCAERPVGQCKGPVDFPCAFAEWVETTAARCQEETSCQTNGWLEVNMGADGCVASIGMDQPNDDILACLAEELGSASCPCMEGTATYLFGFDNQGSCGSECSEEFPCDEGFACVGGQCIAR
jgi:hypothetical protein